MVLAFATSASGANQQEWSQIKKRLENIKAADGSSIENRITACQIKIDRDASWSEAADHDYPQIHAIKGDTIIEIFIDIPLLPGQNPEAYRGLVARWVIHNGEANPESGWANQLQNKPPPIGSSAWMNC